MKKVFVLIAVAALSACGDPEPEVLPGGEPIEQEENCGPEYPNAEPCK